MALQDTIDKKKGAYRIRKEAIKYANAFALAQSASIANAQKNAQVSFDALAASQRDQLQVINDRYLQEQAIIANALVLMLLPLNRLMRRSWRATRHILNSVAQWKLPICRPRLELPVLAGNLAAIAEQGGKESFTVYKRFVQAAAEVLTQRRQFLTSLHHQ